VRRIFEPKREEVVGGWRRLHNMELQVKEVGWGHVAHIGNLEMCTKLWSETRREETTWKSLT
jgi:hypothetical protein